MILGISPALGPLIGGLIGQAFSYTGVFGCAAGTAVLILVLSLFMLPETRPVSVRDTDDRKEVPDSTPKPETSGVFRSFGRIFRNKTGAVAL